MKRTVTYIVIVFLTFQTTLFAYSSNPRDFINELVNDAISNLSNKNLNMSEKADFIKKVALENVDISALGLYTLGELRKSSKEADISKYQTAFEKYFLKSLTSRLAEYSSSKFEVISEEKKSATYTIVNSKVLPIDSKSPRLKLIGEFIQKIQINLS